MPTEYTVQQGEYLAGLAKQFGIPANVIWDHPKNADLKRKRADPNVLFPGDHLYIPDVTTGEESCSTDKLHRFETPTSKLWLRLTLEDQYHQPIANADCVLGVDGQIQKLKTDGNGKIEQVIPPGVQDGFLTIQVPNLPLGDLRIPLKIGYLDPIEEVSGQIARLNNLGYFAGDAEKPDLEALRSAVEEFQCDFGLTVDGICGPKTQSKLKEVYGC